MGKDKYEFRYLVKIGIIVFILIIVELIIISL
jgi:hypothetical protein